MSLIGVLPVSKEYIFYICYSRWYDMKAGNLLLGKSPAIFWPVCFSSLFQSKLVILVVYYVVRGPEREMSPVISHSRTILHWNFLFRVFLSHHSYL